MFSNCPFESSLDIKKDCMICIKNLEGKLSWVLETEIQVLLYQKSKYNSSPTLIDQSLFVFLREFK